MDSSDFASSSSDGDSELARPRFQGSADVWYRYTAVERELVSKLDEGEARDLSQHLYNVHALKNAQNNDPRSASRKRRGSTSSASDSEKSQAPLQAWTAWPLSAVDVPRNDDRQSTDQHHAEEVSSREWNPAADLRQEILAILMRKARVQLLRGNALQTRAEDDAERPALPSSVNDGGSNTHILIDDEVAEHILTPDINAIMSKFDAFLVGLHKNRQGHRVHERPRQKHRVSRPSSPDDDEVDLSEHKRHDETYLRNLLTPRRWSEVVGLAALTGWDSAVVQRASNRCELLFRESMSWFSSSSMTTSRPSGSQDVVQKAGELLCPAADCTIAKASLNTSRRFFKHMRRDHGWTDAAIRQHLASTAPSFDDDLHVSSNRRSLYLEDAVEELSVKRRKLRKTPTDSEL